MQLTDLFESFDKLLPVQWEDYSTEDVKEHVARFTIGEGHFSILFVSKYYEPGYWVVSFTRNKTFDLTGTGSAGAVLATVMGAIREFLKKFNPRFIAFDAKKSEASRLKLYPKLMAMVQKEFPQYQSTNKERGSHWNYCLERPPTPYVSPPPPPPPPKAQEKPMTDVEWEELEDFIRTTTGTIIEFKADLSELGAPVWPGGGS